jgi:8-oxo-dGTP pyrophosphatase MutT (NUDIX family)
MRINFPLPAGGWHEYCVGCQAETVDKVVADGSEHFDCRTCGRRYEREILIDPAVTWWIADDGEYWHETAGVFVRDAGRFLFFERTMFPVAALTVPAGHVDTGESPEPAARRELHEEIGWRAPHLTHLVTEDIIGDSCRRGSDAHRWHAYLTDFDPTQEVTLNEEGVNPRWLTLSEALARDLTLPVRHLIERYRSDLESEPASPPRGCRFPAFTPRSRSPSGPGRSGPSPTSRPAWSRRRSRGSRPRRAAGGA